MIIESRNVKELLDKFLKPVSIECISFDSGALQSCALLSKKNGSVLSLSNSEDTSEAHAINNLRMMSLLIRDKWAEDDVKRHERSNVENSSTVPGQPNNYYKYDLSAIGNESVTTNIYTYEIEELHACVCQIPESDLLLLFIAGRSYPFGLLALKMKKSLKAFHDLYAYKLD